MKTIFVEDTASHRQTIEQILNGIEEVELLGNADSLETGYELIQKTKPELVILDVELYPGTAFDLLERIQKEGEIDFETIFLTGFSKMEYPIRAIQYAALDFIMKPIDVDKLKEAIVRAEKKILQKQQSLQNSLQIPQSIQNNLQIQLLLQNLKSTNEKQSNRIAFHRTRGAIEFVNVNDIVYCEAEKEVTNVFLKDKSHFTATKTLTSYAKLLETDFNFFRISDKTLVNLDYLKTYNHNKDFELELTTGKILNASRRGGQNLKQKVNDSFQSPREEKKNEIQSNPELGILRNILNRFLGK
jgi:two-component system LytT family response regulator